MNFTTAIKEVGKMLDKQVAASDKTNDARRALAVAMQDNGVDLRNKEIEGLLKLNVASSFPKGIGKDADDDQKRAVSAVRQVISTYKKSCEMKISPNNYDTYAEWRKQIYKETSTLTKPEQIVKWLKSDKIELKLSDLETIIESYKAILKAAA